MMLHKGNPFDANRRIIGNRVLYFDTVGSTMDCLREALASGAREGLAIVAFSQQTGRGRMDRAWITDRGGLAVSILLYPPQGSLNEITMLGALGTLAAVEEAGVAGAGIKWPNDIVAGQKKLAGILVEAQAGQTTQWSILGIGVNVNNDVSGYQGMKMAPVSLAGLLGKEMDLAAFARSILMHLDRMYLRLKENHSLYEPWKSRLVTLGKRVCIESGGQKTRGLALDVDHSGSLVVKLDTGQVKVFPAGDVSLE